MFETVRGRHSTEVYSETNFSEFGIYLHLVNLDHTPRYCKLLCNILMDYMDSSDRSYAPIACFNM